MQRVIHFFLSHYPISFVSGIAAIDANTAFLCVVKTVGGGAIYKSTDGGVTWLPSGAGTVFTNTISFPNEIYFWDAANGFTFGDPISGATEIYTTVDSGNTWLQVPPANIPYTTMEHL